MHMCKNALTLHDRLSLDMQRILKGLQPIVLSPTRFLCLASGAMSTSSINNPALTTMYLGTTTTQVNAKLFGSQGQPSVAAFASSLYGA